MRIPEQPTIAAVRCDVVHDGCLDGHPVMPPVGISTKWKPAQIRIAVLPPLPVVSALCAGTARCIQIHTRLTSDVQTSFAITAAVDQIRAAGRCAWFLCSLWHWEGEGGHRGVLLRTYSHAEFSVSMPACDAVVGGMMGEPASRTRLLTEQK